LELLNLKSKVLNLAILNNNGLFSSLPLCLVWLEFDDCFLLCLNSCFQSSDLLLQGQNCLFGSLPLCLVWLELNDCLLLCLNSGSQPSDLLLLSLDSSEQLLNTSISLSDGNFLLLDFHIHFTNILLGFCELV